MDMFLHFIKRNKLIIIIAIALFIGISAGLIYSLDKYADLEIPVSQQSNNKDETTSQKGSVYDKYVNNQTAIDKENGENTDYNTKRSSISINQAIYALDDFMFECNQNIKPEEKIATTKSGKEIFALLNYDTTASFKEKLSEYVVADDKTLTTILNNYGFYIVKDKVGALDSLNSSVYWINRGYTNNILFSNDSIAEVEVPIYQSGTIPISAPVQPSTTKPMTDSFGNSMGGEDEQPQQTVITNASAYPGPKMIVKLKKEHGNWKVNEITYVQDDKE